LKTKYTKQNILDLAQLGSEGTSFIDTDGISYDLDGKGMAEYLTSLGFEVIKHYDNGHNGLVICKEGIQVSTNGFCSMC